MADDNHTMPEPKTAGQLLQEARKQAQIPVAEVATRLNLRPTVIEALEADDNDNLPSSTFVRGYLGSYARLLGIAESEVLQAYQGRVEQAQMQSFSNRTSTERSDSRVMWLTYLIVLVLIGFLVVWWWQKQQNGQLNLNPQTTTEVQPADTTNQSDDDVGHPDISAALESDIAEQPQQSTLPTEPATIVSAPQDELTVAEPSAELPETANEVEASVEADVDSAGAVAILDEVERSLVEQQVEAVSVEQVEQAQVRFMLSKDCWMRVEDATGEVVVEGVKTSARAVEFSGVPPFHAIFGVPDAVTIEYQGEAYPFKVDNPLKTLRLTFPAE
ncbi:membrane protein [Neiella marina]|uniref:Membrane protein n=1 Tax=Neiella marina TaxID=508461 RepID=A0A8J2U254_9GAMM|nr:RodZ domain-containing protein [Neiella marina]GGA65670.1 membrane protein [Neiella marina]